MESDFKTQIFEKGLVNKAVKDFIKAERKAIKSDEESPSSATPGSRARQGDESRSDLDSEDSPDVLYDRSPTYGNPRNSSMTLLRHGSSGH